MHWIVTNFDHRNTNKAMTASKQFFVGFSLFWDKMGQFLLVLASLVENGYKCCLNTLDPSLTHIISQMLWIVTNVNHRNTNKSIYCFYAIFIGFSLSW
ncbi:hypothetical protein AtNW77_Chr1g0042081 [Arabidopsis thaliana]